MEGHPVPKNITDFQFHLVGSMTLKQFLYLAGGLGLAYLVFVILASQVPLIAWPIIIISSIIGAAFAFLPYGDRPLDHWARTYFQAIFKPTQRIWVVPTLNFNPELFHNRLSVYLSSPSLPSTLTEQPQQTIPLRKPPQLAPNLPPTLSPNLPPKLPPQMLSPQPTPTQSGPTYHEPQKEPMVIITEFVNQQAPAPNPPNKSLNPSLKKDISVAREFFQKTEQVPSIKGRLDIPSTEELNKTVNLAKQAQTTQFKIGEIQRQLGEIQAKAAIPGADPKKFQEEFQKVLITLQSLNTEASEISRQLAILSKSPMPQQQPKIKIAPKIEPVNKQIVLTTTPNIINGVVTDNQGNYLQGAIVVTHDKQGLPVRALKTNKLGQFIAATPLGNGIYTITIEKDSLLFDVLEVELKGQVLPPIKIAAKKGGG